MLCRVLVVIGAVSLSSAAGYAQPSERMVPDACRVSSPETLPVLEERRQNLERGIARTTAVSEAAGTQPFEASKSLRTKQEDLLEVLFRIECLQAASLAQPSQGSAGG